ncbi:MAG: hypothetical protein IJR96_01515 [Pseudobutyrivibrio sp.]|nr:hypothetical protein [Pseudobutyrivibrio sp.]
MPMLDGVRASHFYQLLEREATSADRDNKDSWDRFFDMTATMNENGMDVTEQCSRRGLFIQSLQVYGKSGSNSWNAEACYGPWYFGCG